MQKQALKLANALHDLLQGIEQEAESTDYLASFADDADPGSNELWAIVERGKALASMLESYGAQRVPKAAGAPNYNHETREFIKAVSDWWQSNVTDPNRRGAKAVRNRIAAALWIDCGGEFPTGYTGEDWAKRQFWGNLSVG